MHLFTGLVGKRIKGLKKSSASWVVNSMSPVVKISAHCLRLEHIVVEILMSQLVSHHLPSHRKKDTKMIQDRVRGQCASWKVA